MSNESYAEVLSVTIVVPLPGRCPPIDPVSPAVSDVPMVDGAYVLSLDDLG
jgi:hypothetical protein